MKTDKKQEIKNMNENQLSKRLEEILVELSKMNLEFKMGKVKNVHAMKDLRKERAVIKTILTEKQLEASSKK